VHGAATVLAGWSNFYVIVGSAAAALTGLQFVVMALIVNSGAVTGDKSAVSAFGTPTVVHFCAVLLFAALLCAPWASLSGAGLAVGAASLGGFTYVLLALGHVRRVTTYTPVLEDWVFHFGLPLAAYATVLASAIAMLRGSGSALFVVGAAVLALLFAAIHNAWDTATYVIDRTLARR
jgi:hypothetical protein